MSPSPAMNKKTNSVLIGVSHEDGGQHGAVPPPGPVGWATTAVLPPAKRRSTKKRLYFNFLFSKLNLLF